MRRQYNPIPDSGSRSAQADANTLRSVWLTMMLLSAPVAHAAADSELSVLQAENLRLKAEIQQLRASCAIATPPPPVAAVAPVTRPPSAETLEPVPAQPTNATAATPTPAAPPPGYKLVPIAPANSETGCRQGMFEVTQDAPWKHEENWSFLRKAMTPLEVEQLLGKDHYDVTAKGRTAWQFGKCGTLVQGMAVFEDGALLFWKQPDF
jgi:hypothetical protein